VAQPAAGAAPASLRVVTFNVHYGADVDGLARALRGHAALAAADLLLLQEIDSYPEEGRSRAARLAQALGMGHAYVPALLRGDGSTHGLALLTRVPCLGLRVMELPAASLPGGVERRVAFSCDVRLRPGPGQGPGEASVRVVNVHLDTRLNLPERILQLRPALPVPPDGCALVAGDFNTNDLLWAGGLAPQLPVQSATGAGQADALDGYMRGLGYATPTQDLGPTLPVSPGLRLRLDAIYTRGLTAAGGAVERDVDISDHWPLWIDVRP
jgi:endonuclease/exonuclease/phosphatase family metal-dependent hydrolase